MEILPLCTEDYFYCAAPDGKFPKVEGVPEEFYANQQRGQLEFRKYIIKSNACDKCQHKIGDKFSGWMVTPVLYFDESSKEFDEFEMKDIAVLNLWMQILMVGGVVSDGYINLFSQKK